MKKTYLVFFALAGELVGLELVLLYVGQYVGEKLGNGGMGAAAGALTGLVVWVYQLIRAIQKMDNEEK